MPPVRQAAGQAGAAEAAAVEAAVEVAAAAAAAELSRAQLARSREQLQHVRSQALVLALPLAPKP